MSGEPVPQLTKDDLEELLHSKVDSFTISPLTAPGENYGSNMVVVDATLLPDHRKISIAAKLVSEFPHIREAFHFRETVRKEIDMYVRVWPEFRAIQEEYGIPQEMFLDLVPNCYGARTTRGGDIDQPVDETSAILMENLKVSGHRLVDRTIGMDLKHLEYVVTHLARFHATGIAMKLKKPVVFKDAVMKAAANYKRGPPSDKDGKDENPGPVGILKSLSDLPVVHQYMYKLQEVAEEGYKRFRQGKPPESREPFATLIHNDFWTNNMMFSYGGSNDENITGLKIFDFQMISYGSPAVDLLFVLYSSRALDVSKDDCDRLFYLYHREFTKWLELFGSDTEPFNYERFLKEIENEARMCFTHAFVMLRISSIPESKAPDISNRYYHNRMFTDNSGLGESYFKKVEKLVKEFVERKWI